MQCLLSLYMDAVGALIWLFFLSNQKSHFVPHLNVFSLWYIKVWIKLEWSVKNVDWLNSAIMLLRSSLLPHSATLFHFAVILSARNWETLNYHIHWTISFNIFSTCILHFPKPVAAKIKVQCMSVCVHSYVCKHTLIFIYLILMSENSQEAE